MIGIDERTTIDMDTTVRGIRMEEPEIISIIREILSSDVDDGIDFVFGKSNQSGRTILTATSGFISTPGTAGLTAL